MLLKNIFFDRASNQFKVDRLQIIVVAKNIYLRVGAIRVLTHG